VRTRFETTTDLGYDDAVDVAPLARRDTAEPALVTAPWERLLALAGTSWVFGIVLAEGPPTEVSTPLLVFAAALASGAVAGFGLREALRGLRPRTAAPQGLLAAALFGGSAFAWTFAELLTWMLGSSANPQVSAFLVSFTVLAAGLIPIAATDHDAGVSPWLHTAAWSALVGFVTVWVYTP
jgi:uncharacterized membrane protein YedE/YeeE